MSQADQPDATHLAKESPLSSSVTAAASQGYSLEQALVESEARFHKIFSASPDGITVTDLETSKYIDVNEAFTRIFGYEREALIGQPAREIGIWAYPKDREALALALRTERRVRDFHAVGRHKDGSLRTCSLSGEVIELLGRPSIVLVVRDITEQLRTERALRDALGRLSKAFRSSPDALILSDVETGQLLEVNDGFERLYGARREEVIGRTSFELNLYVTPEDRNRLVEKLRKEGSLQNMELIINRHDGAQRTVLVSAELAEEAPRMLMVVTLRDITSLRRAEYERSLLEAQLRQAQKLEALGTLAGGIAHDFNNILTAILANAEMADMDAESPGEVRICVAEIHRAGLRARDLVRQILSFSRVRKEEYRPLFLGAVVKEALALLRSSIPSSIRIEELGLDNQEAIILGDPTQIHQVVMNLATNAAHAMHGTAGVLTLTIRVTAEASSTTSTGETGVVCLEVGDTGHGMSPAVLARLFEPFFTTKPQGEGTGLGLSVVHGIVQSHAGLINVESTPGRGTTFKVRFPLHSESPSLCEEGPRELAQGAGESILFIDDEEQICQFAQRLLLKLGYRVRVCTNPLEALELLVPSQCGFDLVITDLTMPHMTGLDVASRVQGLGQGIPVMICSGLPGSWSSKSLREMGVEALLQKPLSPQTLAREIRRILESPPGAVQMNPSH